MHLLAICFWAWVSWMNHIQHPIQRPPTDPPKVASPKETNQESAVSVCNCNITQGSTTYPISALMGTENSVAFYDYGNPSGSSANTGLEIQNALILFLYEDINTGLISLFLIADIQNDGSGGSMSFEANCVPTDAYISVQDDPGEFSGAPPLITGNWNWQACCTDGGVIENIGCNNTLNLDLLVSSGLDSIVWLTGDIASPTQLLLSMSGEAITINCGGGVCCPVGLDTEVTILDATCPLNADGSIALNPQDGVAPYSYDWSNNATGPLNENLLPGTYMVTVTDAQGCSEELVMTVAATYATPVAVPTNLNLCSDMSPAEFDLTTVEDFINGGSDEEVLWFEDGNISNPILFPETYTTSGGTIYATVNNGFCLSAPVPVVLTITSLPVANDAFLEECAEEPDMATFNLIELEPVISGGIGEVLWYLSANLTNPILDPEEFYSHSQEVYAVVFDGICTSAVASITLIVLPLPEGEAVDMNVCGDPEEEAVFDLTSIEDEISGGNSNVSWYLENDLLDPITSPNAFVSLTTVVYAVLFDGDCNSDPIPIDLIIEPQPMATPLQITACDDGSGEATFNLWDYESQVSGGIGAVEWFSDIELLMPVSNPSNFMTGSTIIYATVDNSTCVSLPVPVTINVVTNVTGNPTAVEACADITGQGIFDLTSVDTVVSGGSGTVTWYADSLGQQVISPANAFVSVDTTVYAQVQNGLCVSDFIPVDLIIVSSVVANPVTSLVCESYNDTAIFDLVQLSIPVSGGVGAINWFQDSGGTIPISSTTNYPSGNATIYAQVVLGACVSSISPISLSVLPGPDVMPVSLQYCGDATGMILLDLASLQAMVSSSGGIFTWYADASITLPVANPNALFTGDTTLYATVFDNICLSPSVEIQIDVSPALTAQPQLISECKPIGEVLTFDLSLLEPAISGGAGMVNWFSDPAGTMVLSNPGAFPVTVTTTVYAHVTDGVCTTPVVPIQIDITDEPVANATAIERCGDPQGQFDIDLTTLDLIISENTGIVTWFADSALTIPVTNPDMFTTGDTMLYAVVTNGMCVSGFVPVTLSLVDTLSVNAITIDICIVDGGDESIDLTSYDPFLSGGSGTVHWFSDIGGTIPVASPAAFVTGGDTLYASIEADGCISDLATIPIVATDATSPDVVCTFTGQDSIAISWQDLTGLYEVSFTINGISGGNPVMTVMPGFEVGGLQNNDTLTAIVSAIYTGVCAVQLSDTVTCITEACPDLTLEIQPPGLLCEGDDPVQLELLVDGILYEGLIIWSGDSAITSNGIFSPANVVSGNHLVNVAIDINGCFYSIDRNILVSFDPISSFTIDGIPCRDSMLQILFNGFAFLAGSDWNWNFAGGMVSKIDPPSEDYAITWDTPGTHAVSLSIADISGCVSDTFTFPVQIYGPVAGPILECREETQNSVSIEWEEMPGATTIEAFSSIGSGTISGNSFIVENLPGDSPVSITVIANGPTLCGPVQTSIECRTLPLPSKTYIPTIFSPNGDGINDIFFIQSNGQHEKVNAMRIFDRWGDVVFEKMQFFPDDPLSGWDGTFGGEKMNPGVYLYWAEVEASGGEVITLVGDVTLIR